MSRFKLSHAAGLAATLAAGFLSSSAFAQPPGEKPPRPDCVWVKGGEVSTFGPGSFEVKTPDKYYEWDFYGRGLDKNGYERGWVCPPHSWPSIATPAPPITIPVRKIRLSLTGGGAYLNGIDVNSSSGFFAGNTQGGAVATLWGGSVFVDIMPIQVPVLGSPMLSIGVVADQTDAQLQFTGRCGGEPCTGTNGSVSETAVIGELNLAFPFGGGNVYNWYAGGGVVFKRPRGNPTGFSGPGIEGSATAPAIRIGGTLMHNFNDSVAAGVKLGYQWAGSTDYDTTLPGERFHFGREGELIFAAVLTFSAPIPGGP